MHYYLVINGYMEVPMFAFSPFYNICSVLLDVSVVFLCLYFICIKRVKLTLASTFLVTLFWSFSNTFYARFFFQYLSLSAIDQVGNLADGLVFDSMISGFQWTDMYYLLSLFSFLWLIRNVDLKPRGNTMFLTMAIIPFLVIFVDFIVYSVYHVVNTSTRGNKELYVNRIEGLVFGGGGGRSAIPNLFRYQVGCVRCLCSEEYDNLFPRILSDQERSEIEKIYLDYSHRVSNVSDNNQIQNVVFIVLESFLSVSSDLKVDGKEITPFLNSLKHSSNIYYNGHVQPNITVGESGDGQFIYMTGLLPCRSKLVLAEVKNKKLPALPKVLKEKNKIVYSEIIIPTTPKVWNQEQMNIVYGIDKMYSYFDLYGSENNSIFLSLNDEQIFDMAIKSNKIKNRPFFSVILSTSTHMPYTDFVENGFELNDLSLPREYRVYLNACHYVDRQIHRYFQHLKQCNVYDKTLIFIMADHHAHIGSLGMEGKITEDLPLYIINSGMDVSKAYKGLCNQLDIYTTVLDILCVDSEWKGLGNTLMTKGYINSVSEKTYELSEKIVEGDYFRDKSK